MDHGLGGYIEEDRDLEILCRDISNMIESLSNKEHRFAEEINYAYFYILLTDMADMMWKKLGSGTPSRHTDMRRSDTIMKGFAELLTEHVRKEINVEFYAEKLCISKQYLSLIVKEKTQVSIGKIISIMRVEEASRLLRDPELTLQQIAEELSFSDQSSFGKFFKKHSGMTPMKYRQSLRKTLLTMR
jgi:AraC-like DNA-binding protein